VQLSGALHRYDGDHFGEIIWSEAGSVDGLPDYYRNEAQKSDRSAFLKFNYNFNPVLSGMLDLQLRGVTYQFEGLDIEGRPFPQEVKHAFFNPKAGLSWTPTEKHRTYLYLGVAHREPNRDDYITAHPAAHPKPEKLYNAELGWEYNYNALKIGLNGYYMFYKDQLVLTGRINDVGEYARQNIDESYRLGAELVASWTDQKWDAAGTATISNNRVKAFDEYIDDWDNPDTQILISHDDTPLAFSPELIASTGLGYHILTDEQQDLRIGANVKYVGEQYIDNTGNASSILESYATTDLRISYKRKIGKAHVEAQILVRNLFDQQYSSNAWIYRFQSAGYDPRPDDPYAELESGSTYHLQGLFPQAGRNVLAGITVRF
jgi:iron complex outermembrane receptor protein